MHMLILRPKRQAQSVRVCTVFYLDQVNVWGPLLPMADSPLGMRAQHRERATSKENEEAILLNGREPNYWSECFEPLPNGFHVEFCALGSRPSTRPTAQQPARAYLSPLLSSLSTPPLAPGFLLYSRVHARATQSRATRTSSMVLMDCSTCRCPS